MTVQQISVADFGALPNSTVDATQAVAKAIESTKGRGATIVFPAGEYHFHRDKGFERVLHLSNSDVVNPRRIAILVDGHRNLKLVGKGARLVFHDPIIPLAILNSQRITFEGFEIDWARPMMSQGTVVAADSKGVTLAIDPERYPYRIEGGKLAFTSENWSRPVWGFMEFDPRTKGVAYGTGDAGSLGGGWDEYRAVEVERGRVRLEHPFKRLPRLGNVLVARHGARDHAGTFVSDSKDIEFRDVAYRFTSGLGILSQFSENLTMRNVSVAPAPDSDRLFAGHDDGLHFSNCKGRILVEGCRFEGLMDDPINVHGTSVRVEKNLAEDRLRCRLVQGVGLKYGDVGDTISFLNHESLLSRGQAKVKALKHLSLEEFEIEFDRPVPSELVQGDALENLTWTPSLTVRKSEFGTVRARGLLVTTPKKVLIEDNLFRSSGSAILIAGDANGWYETGAVKDVTIRRNRFENCLTSVYQFCEAVISIFPEISKPGAEAYHRNIRIEDNVFTVFDAPVLWAKSAGDLTFKNNEILTSNRFKPWHWNKDGITLLNCQRVTISGNRLAPLYRGRSIREAADGKVTVSPWP